MTSLISSSSLPITPVAVCPSAITHAPVNVAASTTAAGLNRFAYTRTSASTSRPSASVLMISMCLPFDARTTSPGFTAVPGGMLVVAPISPTTFTGSSRRAIASNAPSTPAAPHVELHELHRLRWLDGDAARIEAESLPNEDDRRVARLAAPVLESDQLRILRRSLRNAEE